MVLPRLKCGKCGHVWVPRTDRKPKACPGCGSRKWGEPKAAAKAAK